ncbi:MAG TPA: N-acetylmuramoyl-L-alanine amidase, partial [Phycisphaerales bacterium]|nr:N-acetylmuramoyl-L-alanine amidase [Phycisphaerales bacterium]
TASGGSGTIGAVSDQDRVRAFVPTNEDTLVVNGVEGPSVPNLQNWRGTYKNPDGSFSQAKMTADRQFKANNVDKYIGGGYRAPGALNKIVLHETADFVGIVTLANAFRVLDYTRPDGTTTKYKTAAHFCINRDGTIVQLLDVCELAEHGQDISSSSIGIEFANKPWGSGGCAEEAGITPLKVPPIPGMPTTGGTKKKTCLYIPGQAQLEALVTLLKALFAHPALSNLRQTWMSVVNINPAKLTTEKLDDLKAYFIINNARTFITDPKFSAINGNVSSGGWSLNTPGVFYHNLYGTNSDGMIQGFYTWLRISQNLDAQEAMTTFKAYIASEANRVSAGGGVAMVDVSKLVFREA